MDKPVYVTKAGKVYAYYPYSSNDSPPVLPLDMTKQTDVLYSRVASPIAQVQSPYLSNCTML